MTLGDAKWSTAFSRFGLGARGLWPRSQGDPRAAIKVELDAPGAGEIRGDGLKSSAEAMALLFEVTAQRAQEAKDAAARATPMAEPMAKMEPPKPKPPSPLEALYLAEAETRIAAGCAADIGFVERLVAFWSNHFCVSAARGLAVRVTAGAFEREAIRPHALGRFADMLKAVERHPAMLYYLDNVQSTGPESKLGKAAKRGLNENLGREILELHTLGADSGYTQTDVTELARALTGWTVAGRDGKLGLPGAFAFNADAHAGGERALLGRRYPEGGVEQGEAALDDLARAPATARHVAGKFARAFVADYPSAALTDRLTKVFLATDGDLAALARALLDDDEAWSAAATKIRDPWEMMIGAHRALGLEPGKPQRFLRSLSLLGMPLWSPGGPNGFGDAADAWVSPEGVKTRVEIAAGLGRLAKDAPAPKELIDRVLPDVSDLTRETLLRAESRPQAYALLILAPEFQRR